MVLELSVTAEFFLNFYFYLFFYFSSCCTSYSEYIALYQLKIPFCAFKMIRRNNANGMDALSFMGLFDFIQFNFIVPNMNFYGIISIYRHLLIIFWFELYNTHKQFKYSYPLWFPFFKMLRCGNFMLSRVALVVA